jgi:hypothetical protein
MRKVVHTFNKETGIHKYYGSLVAAKKWEESLPFHTLVRFKGEVWENKEYIVRFGRLVPSRFRSDKERIVESNVESAIVGKTVVGAVMPSCLRLSLKTKWFEMTKAKIKPEDYREINDYWCRRLLELDEETEWDIWQELIEDLANPKRKHEDVYQCLSFFGARFKKFDCNIMALGYAKSSDNERILKLEHKGIEIRTGNPEWGAEPNKLYFVIMHGAILA